MDLEFEFDDLLDNEGGEGVGRWVLLRSFTNVLSKYWDEITKESVGGPKYEYNDTLIRAYSVPSGFGMSMAADGLTRIAPGDIPTNARIYFVKSFVPVKLNDIIYELNWRNKEKPTVVFDLEDEDRANGIVAPVSRNEVLKPIVLGSDTAGGIDYIKLFAEEHILR